MLVPLKQFIGSSLQGTDGEVGTAKDVLFDSRTWDLRYLVVDTGTWLPGRKVLLSPTEVVGVDWDQEQVSVRRTKEQVKEAPHVDSEQPVSRQMEVELAAYYGWPAYWEGGVVMGAPAPVMVERPAVTEQQLEKAKTEQRGDPELRSFQEVQGYRLTATDGEAGHLRDFIVDDQLWSVRYLVLDTGNWLPGRRVLLSPDRVEQIEWARRSVVTNLSQEDLKSGQDYDSL